MNEEKYLAFLKQKLEESKEIEALSTEDEEFKTWWSALEGAAKRFGGNYAQRFAEVDFWVHLYPADEGEEREAFLDGVKDARSKIRATIAEIETFGLEDNRPAVPRRAQSAPVAGPVVNVTLSQQQSQSIARSIDLSGYDSEVQDKVQELLDELRKSQKDESKLEGIVKWLANKSADVLVALIAAAATAKI